MGTGSRAIKEFKNQEKNWELFNQNVILVLVGVNYDTTKYSFSSENRLTASSSLRVSSWAASESRFVKSGSNSSSKNLTTTSKRTAEIKI